jgi:ATP-dependent RNA helicase DeaD
LRQFKTFYKEFMLPNPNLFSSFGLSDVMLKALEHKGFTEPTSIQALALPRLLAGEGHLIVKARTGTGKTAAFGIPLIEHLAGNGPGHAAKALILTPTRELALQVSREIASMVTGGCPRITAVYGGASIRNQILDLKRGTEIVVGTPGRVMDLMERKILDLSAVEWLILDEADEMLDMGFLEDVETIMAQVNPGRRVALFSATMPDAILRVVKEHIGEVDILEDTAPADEKPAVDQYYMVLKKEDRIEALRRIIDQAEDFYGLVFCATKIGADELARRLVEGGYAAEAIHGDLSQEARERTLRRFRSKMTTVLVATDVAARGLDIERLTHVINYDLPGDRETYVHRIGRTGRAGRRGRAVSLALPGEQGRMAQLSRSMERLLGSGIERTKVPSVKTVMKSLKSRIVFAVSQIAADMKGVADGDMADAAEIPAGDGAALTEAAVPFSAGPEASVIPPAGETASPEPVIDRLGQELIEKLGAEEAVAALLSLHYGEVLDPSRYAPVTDIPEAPVKPGRGGKLSGVKAGRGSFRHGGQMRSHDMDTGEPVRVYVGLGRKHGASARDVAGLLMRAGGVAGRFVDAIVLKDFCAFATMPGEAARRACAFSRNTPGDPPIRLSR